MSVCFSNKMLGNFKDQLINLVLILMLVDFVYSKDLHLKENDEVSENSEEMKRDAPQYYNEIFRHARYARNLDTVTESGMGHVFNNMKPNVLNNFFKRIANQYTAERRRKIERKKRMMKKKSAKKIGKRKKSKKWFEDAANNAPKKNERKYRNKMMKFTQKQEEKDGKSKNEVESKGSEYIV